MTRRQEPSVRDSFEISYWVWHRGEELSANERKELKKQGVTRLFWRVAELRCEEGRWEASSVVRLPASTSDLEIVPLFRLAAESATLDYPKSYQDLAKTILNLSGENWTEIQLDYDCPERRLESYGEMIDVCRSFWGGERKISITALASYGRSNGFRELAEKVDAVYPMFYDLLSDEAKDVQKGRFRPLADVDLMKRWLGEWKNFPVPWYVGVPAFSRLTAFDGQGEQIGHWRDWSPERIASQKGVQWRAGGSGWARFSTEQSLRIGLHRFEPEMHLVLRWPDPEILSQMVHLADEAGAWGVIAFRLPGRGGSNVLSLEQIGASMNDTVVKSDLVVSLNDDGELTLSNKGKGDFLADWKRGKHSLELRCETAAWRSVDAGDFLTVAWDRGKPLELSRGLSFSFVDLPVGASLMTGRLEAVRLNMMCEWRINKGEWRPLR